MPACYFIITGFGPFAGVPNNPTSILIQRLQEQLDNKHNKHIYKTHILETSAEYARAKLSDIYKGLKQASSEKSKDVIIILHLGVNYCGTRFHLEQCAYNDATFRVADERGYRPNKELVLAQHTSSNETTTSTHEWGKCLKTTLDVQSLCNDLQKEDNAEKVVVSTDPGRFVCNYTYCFSLDQCSSSNGCSGDKGKKQHNALFIHVPPFRVISESRQLDFIHKVMDTIEKQVLSSTD